MFAVAMVEPEALPVLLAGAHHGLGAPHIARTKQTAVVTGTSTDRRQRALILRSVPEDIAVVGFDDLPIARRTDPPLTTVHQPIQAPGPEMAKMLVGLIDREEPISLILSTRLTVRASTTAE